MDRPTRVSSRRVANHVGDMVKEKQKRGAERSIKKTVTLPIQGDMTSPVKKESKFNITKKVSNRINAVTQSMLQIYDLPVDTTYSCSQDSNTKVTKKNGLTPLTYYFLGNTQVVPNCVQEKEKEEIKKEIKEIKEEKEEIKEEKEEIISDIEHFKIDETPVAVPVHGPSTPHRINMPLENLDKKTTVMTKEKQSLIVTLHSPPQITKKSAPCRRKKTISDQLLNNSRSSKLTAPKSTNHTITEYFPIRRSVRKSKKVVLEEKQRDLEDKVLRQVEEGLKIKIFPGKGRGIVTTREFAKGEFVVEYIGELINQGEAKEREKLYAQDQNAGCYMYYFQHHNQQFCVDATAETDKLGRLVNHSRNGNLITRIVEVKSIPHLVLTAKEDIPIGVEVSYDYGDRNRESIRNHPWLAL